ncbi:hypothetical protein R9C00_15510 [Flammeovirgaceae bacterium SG7u.111]|nr:hypothetical protein [Flammeovirgaceae bacterium SG7u.132]WPO33110.1 hypothetical protein R9C00_15510 [Flammeovirgaceae bacterium SG7u.111]
MKINKIYKGEVFNVSVDEEIPAIYEQWLGRVNGEEFRELLLKKLEIYKKQKIYHPDLNWINDITGLRGPETEDQLWARNEFHPQLYPSGVRKIASIVPPQTYLRLPDGHITGFTDNTGIRICYFDSYADAATWLMKK